MVFTVTVISGPTVCCLHSHHRPWLWWRQGLSVFLSVCTLLHRVMFRQTANSRTWNLHKKVTHNYLKYQNFLKYKLNALMCVQSLRKCRRKCIHKMCSIVCTKKRRTQVQTLNKRTIWKMVSTKPLLKVGEKQRKVMLLTHIVLVSPLHN